LRHRAIAVGLNFISVCVQRFDVAAGCCRPPGGMRCVINVVSDECGEEIAGYVRSLGTKVLPEMDFAKNKRQSISIRSL